MSPKIISLSLFMVSYLLFAVAPKWRTHVAVLSSLLLLALGAISPNQAFWAINWNVMGIFVGTLIVADLFMESRVPAYMAEAIVNWGRSTAWAILLICLLTGFISAFVENVATVLIVAPIAFSLARKLKINPVNMMIAIAVSSNLQGTATLIGDPPSMLLGGFAKMNFMDFFFYHGKPSIFFAVELGALVSFIVLYFIFRAHREKIKLLPAERVKSWVPTFILIFLILLLAASSFFDVGFSYMAGAICMIVGALSLIWDQFENKISVMGTVKDLDWDTALFLAGVFILVGSITLTGWINEATVHLSAVIGGNVLLGYVLIVVSSVALSAFVDNVPFLAAMLPVAIGISASLDIAPSLYLFGLLIGASLGGNITPIGASANIVACSLLKKEGHVVSFGEFGKIGIPFTLAAVSAAALFVWFVWR